MFHVDRAAFWLCNFFKLLHFLKMYSSLIGCVDEDSDNKD